MTTYFISIGGSGARVVEALIHLCGAGLLGTQPLRILFIDPDQSNGNLNRTKSSLGAYTKLHNLLAENGLRSELAATRVEEYTEWSPFHHAPEVRCLRDFYNYPQYKDQPVGRLLRVLYTNEELNADLGVGFRGRPAIGAAVMSQLDLEMEQDAPPWSTLINEVKNDSGDAKIFLCGSIFGGTGASGFPTIGRLIKNKLEKESLQDRVKLGGLLMLPYFKFDSSAKRELCARSEEFLINTQAALLYYQKHSIFNTIYLLGDSQVAQIPKEKVQLGNDGQRNDPHYIELLGGLAAIHYFQNKNVGESVVIARHAVGALSWEDLPNGQAVRQAVLGTALFAHLWLGTVKPNLNNPQLKLVNAPWLESYYRLGRRGLFGFGGVSYPEISEEQMQIKQVTDYCNAYLTWLVKLLRSGQQNVNLNGLLPVSKLPAVNSDETVSPVRDRLSELFQVSEEQILTELQNKQSSAAGTAGLVADLYSICRTSIQG